MAIAIASTRGTSAIISATSATVQLTVADANSWLAVGIGQESSVAQTSVAIWDSTTANSSLSILSESASTGLTMRVFALFNPSTGTHVVLCNGLSSAVRKGLVGVVVTGLDSTTPVDTGTISVVNGVSTATTSTAIPSAAGDLLLSFINIDDANSSVVVVGSSGSTLAFSDNADGTMRVLLAQVPGDATVAVPWNWASAGAYGSVTMNLNASGAAAATPFYVARRGMMGLGR